MPRRSPIIAAAGPLRMGTAPIFAGGPEGVTTADRTAAALGVGLVGPLSVRGPGFPPFGPALPFRESVPPRREGSDHADSHRRRRWAESAFCPACGSTVCWEAERAPGRVVVAAGAFADPDFPAPYGAVWTGTECRWVPLPEGVPVRLRQT